MTRICCYCKPKHIIGKDDGSGVYTHGLCWKAALREDIKWYFHRAIHWLETLILPLALVFFGAHFLWWEINDFRIEGEQIEAGRGAPLTQTQRPTGPISTSREADMRPTTEKGLR